MNDSLIKKRQLSLKKVLVQHQKNSSFSGRINISEHIDYNDGFVYRQQLTKSSVLLSKKIPLPRKLRLTLMIRLKLI
jgi:galactokinase